MPANATNDRQRVIDLCLSARTGPELDRAESLLSAWMREHPDDWSICWCGEQMAMMREAMKGEDG